MVVVQKRWYNSHEWYLRALVDCLLYNGRRLMHYAAHVLFPTAHDLQLYSLSLH
jgi:hypothetical protein